MCDTPMPYSASYFNLYCIICTCTGSSEGSWTDYHLEGQKRHVCVENQSDEVDGLGSVSLSVWSRGMDNKEIG